MSSLELQRDSCPSSRTNELRGEHENKNMKKSMHIYCSTNDSGKDDYFLKQFDEKSLNSSISSNIGSAHFTEKFQHYKKQHHQLKKERVIRLEEFQLGMEIGSGKYGKVHIARHRDTGFICAIKSVSKKIIKEENLEIPFMREVKIQMYLSHPNIVKLYGYFHDKEKIYLIMEYCSGNHLFKLIRQKKQFEEKEIIQILGNIFEAVSFIHCHGVIHRDLKPENIVIENVRLELLRESTNCATSDGQPTPAATTAPPSAEPPSTSARKCSRASSTTPKPTSGDSASSPTNWHSVESHFR